MIPCNMDPAREAKAHGSNAGKTFKQDQMPLPGTYSKNLPRLYDAARARASYAKKVNEKLRREIAFLQMENGLLRGKVQEQRQIVKALEERIDYLGKQQKAERLNVQRSEYRRSA